MFKPKKVNKPIIIYGKGNLGKLAIEIFEYLKLTVVGSIDQAEARVIVPPSQYTVAVAVATSPFNGIREFLIKRGYVDIVPFWDIVEAYPKLNIHNGWFARDCSFFDEEWVEEVQAAFSDLTSVVYYLQFKKWRQYRIEEIAIPPTNAGYCTLPATLLDVRKRQKGWKSPHFCPSTFGEHISIHVEGRELQTIHKYIKQYRYYRPVLDVTCYHSPDGLWRIQKFLIDNLKDYIFKFRCHAYCGQAAVFYCTPKEVEE